MQVGWGTGSADESRLASAALRAGAYMAQFVSEHLATNYTGALERVRFRGQFDSICHCRDWRQDVPLAGDPHQDLLIQVGNSRGVRMSIAEPGSESVGANRQVRLGQIQGSAVPHRMIQASVQGDASQRGGDFFGRPDCGNGPLVLSPVGTCQRGLRGLARRPRLGRATGAPHPQSGCCRRRTSPQSRGGPALPPWLRPPW